MIRHLDIQLALQQRLLTLSVCTTGAISLSATATGYARLDAGSFLSDGFAVGMELTASGFGNAANNGSKVVTAVSTATLSCAGTIAESSGGGRTLSVGLPTARAWENISLDPTTASPYVDEQYVPATSELRGMVIGGTREDTGLYIVGFHSPLNIGPAALARYADAVIAFFPMVQSITIANGDLRVRGDIGPVRGQLFRLESGFARVGVTIPWRLLTLNN